MITKSYFFSARQTAAPVWTRYKGTDIVTLAVLIGLLLIGLVSPSFGQSEGEGFNTEGAAVWTISRPQTPFDALANELLKGLKKTAPDPSLFGNTNKPGPKVAVLPFIADDIPISPHLARELNDRLIASILSATGQRFRIMSQAEIRILMGKIAEFSHFDDAADPLATLMRQKAELGRTAKPDILIMGTIRNDGNSILLSYKAAWLTTGQIVAGTLPHIVAKAGKANVAQLSLKQVAKKAAGHFREYASDMSELHLGSIRYKNLGGQPELGSYIRGIISIALQNAYANILTDRKLIVKQAILDAEQIDRIRKHGLSKQADVPRPNRQETYDQRRGVYVLSGSYWRLEDAFEVRFSLKDAQGQSVSFIHTVAANSMPQDLGVEPDPSVADFAKVGNRAVDLRLSSDRGDNPVYHVGQDFNFVVELAADAWLYCFYFDATGNLYKIFPNKGHPSAYLPGPKVYTIPGDKLFKFEFGVKEPLGMEALKCFAAKRDISKALPSGIMRPFPAAIGKGFAQNLTRYMQQHAQEAVSEVAIVVTVEK